MMIFFWRMTAALFSVIATILLLTACTFPEKLPRSLTAREASALPAIPSVHVVTPRPRIAQRGHGQRAIFVRCIAADCPAVTRKTLAVEQVAESPPNTERADAASRWLTAAATSQQEIAAPESTELSPLPNSPTESETVTVVFAFGEATLSPQARDAIDRAATLWPSSRHVVIRGRTDNIGSLRANEALAWARAHAVRDHLRLRHPVLAAVVSVDARGACCFTTPNDTPAGRARNRRVEIVFERQAEGM